MTYHRSTKTKKTVTNSERACQAMQGFIDTRIAWETFIDYAYVALIYNDISLHTFSSMINVAYSSKQV